MLTRNAIVDDLINRRAKQYEQTLVMTKTRGRAKLVDAFRAGMNQMYSDLGTIDANRNTFGELTKQE